MKSCPQCNADVPSDNAFCGKCGYAMRDQGPHHLDRSRIRVHEGPPSEPPPVAKQRPRQKTVLGIPPAAAAGEAPKQGAAEEEEAPPVSPRAAAPVSPKAKGPRVPQKTMLGLPQLEVHKGQLQPETQATQELSIEDLAFQLPAPPTAQSAVGEESPQPVSAAPPRSDQSPPRPVPSPPPPPFQVTEDTPDPGDAEEDRDSLSLPPPLAARRRWVFLVCALLLVLSIGWLLYRFLAGPAASA